MVESSLYAGGVAEEQTKFRVIADDLETRIRAGEFSPGSRLPSKAMLMDRYRETLGTVALGTLDKAFSLLREHGLIETRRGSGTYVCDPLPEVRAPVSVSDELAGLRSRIAEISAVLGIAEDADTVRAVEDVPPDPGASQEALLQRVAKLEERLREIDGIREAVTFLQGQLIDLYQRTGHAYPYEESGPGKQSATAVTRDNRGATAIAMPTNLKDQAGLWLVRGPFLA